MLTQNKRFADFHGVTDEWMQYSKGVQVITGEKPDKAALTKLGYDLITPDPDYVGNAGHDTQTALLFYQAAPYATLIAISAAINTSVTPAACGLLDSIIPYIKEQGDIPIMFLSQWASNQQLQPFYDKINSALAEVPGFYAAMASGNLEDTDGDYNHYGDCPEIYLGGAFYLNADGSTTSAPCNVSTEKVSFAGPTLISYPVNAKDGCKFYGTSGFPPWEAGMLACVQGFFKAKRGAYLSRKGLYQFRKDYSVNLGTPLKLGAGALVLPDPATIDVQKYAEETMKTIILTIGSNIMTVDGVAQQMDVAPFIQDDRAFIPVRFVSEALGATVEWNDPKITITQGAT